MTENQPAKTKIDRLVEGEPLRVAGKDVQLVARLQGWITESYASDHAFGASAGRLTPAEVRVEETGSTSVITIQDPHRRPLGQMARVGAVVSVGCLVTMLAVRFVTFRR